MDNEKLSNLYNEVENFWLDYNEITEKLNKEKDYIKNYNYKNEKKYLKIASIIAIIINSIFKIIVLSIVNYIIYDLFNIDINKFIENVIIFFTIVYEIKSTKKYLKNKTENLEQKLLDKLKNIEALSKEKEVIRTKIYGLTDKINLIVNESLSEEDNPTLVSEEPNEEIIIEPYIEYEDKVKTLKREINKSKNRKYI